MIYLDNAATTFPKPPEVLAQMTATYARLGCSPGRGGYDAAVEAEEFVFRVRSRLAGFFGAPDPNRVVFAQNATDALNLCLQGALGPGDHVVSTRLEHNSVLRVLFHLQASRDVRFDLVPFDGAGFIDPDDVARAIRPETRLVVINHASNVLGTVQPAAEIGRACRERGVPLVLDAAQSAGLVPLDMTAWGVSAVAFTGHKALLGPTGIGGLAVAPELELASTRFGGTGVDSQSLFHTPDYPQRLEAGTLNLLGVIGLSAGLDYLAKDGPGAVPARELILAARLWDGLARLKRIQLYGQAPAENHVPLFICNVDGMRPTDVGAVLDGDFGVAVRTGLHCAPLAHEDLGLGGRGAVRFSLGYATTAADIDQAVAAMAQICGQG
ncbi:MAG: aminotransferase class V-fold PLP-dependent enzyme [Pseudomonadota bacterium]